MPPRRQQNPPPTGDQYEVRGPTSALTSFLREQGITGNIHRRPQPPTPVTNANTNANAVAGPSNVGASTSASTSTSTSSSPGPSASTSDQTTSILVVSNTKKRVSISTATTAAAKKKKKQQDEDDEDEDGFLIGGVKQAPKKGRYENRAPGSIAICAECGKKFTVTKYTPTNPSGPGLLCSPCSNESIEDLATRSAPKPSIKPKLKKRASKASEDKDQTPIKSLQSSCIAVIGKHINNVEGFGDIGPKNLDRIAKIVSKHRALDGGNLELFLGVDHRELHLYDCTNLKDTDLESIGSFSPHLERLTLNMCGRIDDKVLKGWGERLRELKYLSLYAPYLITPKGWNEYFQSFEDGRQLEGFGLRQSARFDDTNIITLVKHHPSLFNLQLSEIGKLSDQSLGFLHPLTCLTSLDISKAGVIQGSVLTDDAVVALLEKVGRNLGELNLGKNHLLTDRTLLEGIGPNCPILRSLNLSFLDLLTPSGVADLFTTFTSNVGLTHLNLHRCLQLDNTSLSAIIKHSSHSIKELDLHSVDELDDDILKDLAKKAKECEKLDVSFVRAVDDFVVKEILEGMVKLKVLFLHGNNRVTDDCPTKKGVSIRGRENSMHVEL